MRIVEKCNLFKLLLSSEDLIANLLQHHIIHLDQTLVMATYRVRPFNVLQNEILQQKEENLNKLFTTFQVCRQIDALSMQTVLLCCSRLVCTF